MNAFKILKFRILRKISEVHLNLPWDFLQDQVNNVFECENEGNNDVNCLSSPGNKNCDDHHFHNKTNEYNDESPRLGREYRYKQDRHVHIQKVEGGVQKHE